MKWLLILLCILLTGCVTKDIESTVPIETQTIAELTEPQAELSHEIAMLEGFVVMDEGDVRHNAASWFHFLENCKTGNPASVTVVQFELIDTGYTYLKYDLTFDGKIYKVEYEKEGKLVCEQASELVCSSGVLNDTAQPYDSYLRYSLNDLIIYNDYIAEPDFEGVTEIFLHDKEGEPAIKSFTGDSLQPVLELLWNSDYVSDEPEDYAYGMKLLMTNRDGMELVIELDLNHGNYRYGMQTYEYGEVTDMLAVLGMEQWPDSVLREFGILVD